MGFVPPPPPKRRKMEWGEESDMTAQQKGGARFDMLNAFFSRMPGMKGTTQEVEILVGIMFATAQEARARGYTLNLDAKGEVRAVLGVAGVVSIGDPHPAIITSKSVMEKIALDDLIGTGRRKVTPKK